MKKIHNWLIGVVFIILFSTSSIFGQDTTHSNFKLKPNYKVSRNSPYKLSLKTDISITAASIVLLTITPIINNQTGPLTIEEIKNLEREDVWIVDRGATYNNNDNAARASDVLFITALTLPSLFLFDKNIRKDYRGALIYAEIMLLTGGITGFTKIITERARPYTYNEKVPDDRKIEKTAKRSFFSGHTSFTAASTFYMAAVYSEHHPYSPMKPLVWTLAATIPLTTGILRVASGRHFPTDVFVGYVIGAGIGYLVPHLHKIFRRKKSLDFTKH